MLFRLKRAEAVRAGFQRIVREQIDNAIAHLGGPPAQRQRAVHETRKSFKRIRALLRLLRPELGEVFKTENDRIRQLSARLSPYRDADAMIETLEKLHRNLPDLFDQAMFDTAHQHLRSSRNRVLQSDTGYAHDAAQVVDALREVNGELAHWPLPEDLGKVGKVLKKSYSRVRKAARQARNSDEVEDFHTWRKRVKDLLYQSQMLRKTELKLPGRYRKAVEGLAETLGEHHDLTVFEELLVRPDVFPDQQHAATVLKPVTHRRKQLEDATRKTGADLFKLPAKRFFAASIS